MSKRRVIRYTVYHPTKDIGVFKFKRYTIHKGFASPRTMRQALKIAGRLGKGAIIERLSRTKGGKLKVTEWERIA